MLHLHRVHHYWLLIFSLAAITSLHKCGAIAVTVNFTMKGVEGTINFNQLSIANSTVITVSLSGLYPSESFPWHIHNYPFTTAQRDPCSAASVGGHFDPFMVGGGVNYFTSCSNNHSLCEVGDLSGKHGRLNSTMSSSVVFVDSYLPLYGVHSILGRSIVIHRENGARWVCANIGYPSDVTVAYSPFRTVLAGSIFFIEPYSPINLTTVFVRLSYISGPVNSNSHNWHVHRDSIGDDDDCDDGGPHYNPRRIDVNSSDYSYCSPSNQTACEVGDLTGKSSLLNFTNGSGSSTLLYSDTDLPVRVNRLHETILNRSVVISNSSQPVCANLLEYSPRIAGASFQKDGVTGQIMFNQSFPFSSTTVTVNLNGLASRASDIHIHEFPVDEITKGNTKCTDAGGHYNPTNIIRNSSSPTTLDAYGIGDLSGKSSLKLKHIDKISFSYQDPYLPLFGTDSIVGRSVVIHRSNGDPWLCANIMYDSMDTITITTPISVDDLQGRLVFTQLANDPFSETTIFLDLNYVEPSSSSFMVPGTTPVLLITTSPTIMNTTTIEPPGSGSQPGNDSRSDQKKDNVVRRQAQGLPIFLTIQKECNSTNYSAPPSSPSCSRDNQLACPIGDLIGKHGPLSPGRNLLTDLNLPLTGPKSIAEMKLVVRTGDANSSVLGCVSLRTPLPSVVVTSIPTATRMSPTVSFTPSINPTIPFPSTSGTPRPSNESTGKKSSNIVAIACGVAGGIGLLLILAVIVYCYMRRRRKTQSADFVSRSDTRGRGYEPLQLELTKKGKSKRKKSKRSEDYVEL